MCAIYWVTTENSIQKFYCYFIVIVNIVISSGKHGGITQGIYLHKYILQFKTTASNLYKYDFII